tara:strand:+ start:116 stop:388 length:273 start_codon:yes stop_codon:yes gene_type:complete
MKTVYLVQFENGTWGYILRPSITTEVEGINGDGTVRATQRSGGVDTTGYKYHYLVLSDEWDDHDLDSMTDAGWTETGTLNVDTGDFALAS